MIMQLEHSNIHTKNKFLQKQTKALRQLSPVQPNNSNKRVGYAKFALLLLVIVILFNSKQYIDNKLSQNFSTAIGQKTSVKTPNSTLELQRIYEYISNDQQWTNKRISLFVYHWESLDRNKQKQLKFRQWFQQFSLLLANYIEAQSASRDDQEIENLDLVKTLAIVLGRKDLAIEYSDQDEQDFTPATDIEINETSLIDIEVTAEESEINIDFTEDSSEQPTDEVLAVVIPEITPELKSEKVQSEVEENQLFSNPESQIIFLEDVETLVHHYKNAYQMGNTSNLLKLFASDGIKFTQLKEAYRSIFKSSKKRRIEIKNLNWEFSNNQAIGTGSYKAIHEMIKTKGTQTISAKVKFNFQIKDEQLRIMDLSLLEPQVKFERATKSKRVKKKNKTHRKRRTKPTMAELYDVVNRYTEAYEEGSIRTLLSLFSTNVRTNTKNNITAVQEDYANLFDRTQDRQMFISHIDWSIEDNYARGVGLIETVIIPNDGRKAYSTSGTIQIMTKKIGNKLLITNLYEN
jgi:hypothetical protein